MVSRPRRHLLLAVTLSILILGVFPSASALAESVSRVVRDPSTIVDSLAPKVELLRALVDGRPRVGGSEPMVAAYP